MFTALRLLAKASAKAASPREAALGLGALLLTLGDGLPGISLR
jgi:hypothetical protein